jgi:hypothetical protein
MFSCWSDHSHVGATIPFHILQNRTVWHYSSLPLLLLVYTHLHRENPTCNIMSARQDNLETHGLYSPVLSRIIENDRGKTELSHDENTPENTKACLLKDDILPSWLPLACLEPGRVPLSADCDWDRLFHVESDDELYNRTQNVVTTEMYTHTDYSGTESTLKLSVDFVAFLNFTTYQLDPSSITNPMHLVQTNYLPKTGSVIKVDPSWLLAAWSVDNKGILYPAHTTAIQMV